MTVHVTADDLVNRLGRLRSGRERTAVAFDADGTLWSGDVGEDVFRYALEHGCLRNSAAQALGAVAEQFRVSSAGNANAVASRILEAFESGIVPDKVVCEVMTWAYAGFSVDEFRTLGRRVLLDECRLGDRLQRELGSVFAWARAEAVRVIVVSASPRILVELGAALLGIGPPDIAAADPVVSDGVIGDRMAHPLPFALAKCVAGRALIGDAAWLASFGDNFYDFDMLQAAELGVAVRPKPALVSSMTGASNLLVLEAES